MSLAFGRPIRVMPGPSHLPDRVLNAMHREAPNIYEGELVGITDTIRRDLCALAGTDGALAMYIANGHAAWEAALVNTLAPGDRVLALVTGRFGHGWAQTARDLGLDVATMDFGTDRAADPARLEARLRADRGHALRAVLTVQTDTATSVNNDVEALGAALRAAGHPALYMVDSIASFCCAPMRMDAWGIDVLLTACQKGLMTPPGISFTFAGPRARQARRRLQRVSPYFDWLPRFDPQLYYQNFHGTAPTHHLFGLRAALDMILEEGIDNVLARHAVLARCVWAAAEAWAGGAGAGGLRLNVAARAQRSVAVTTLLTGPGDGARLRRWCEDEAGLTLGAGLPLGAGMAHGDGVFRIGHMGHLNPPMLLGALATVDAGLKALGIAHGDGALRLAAETLADALPAAGTGAAAAE
ncbi:aminotransferase class V-fold PLP-dependent enzyme [Rhodobacteraceae bacterium 2CG4]|uniref:Aminotransferase class V-fold PLP-dependent enzyme n=1 Tax=Halovulum marinum TaxID=2662447 RepID=A0A6L5YXT9_9RHOB|nr:aminotransferase class V-fold PLP-dependent enzyme [Halovulum marinum]MSU88635.1 aminotransferase class V-fold PLP-dependent enzyme [Halovulum marinum]